jgi:hypothetical protein
MHFILTASNPDNTILESYPSIRAYVSCHKQFSGVCSQNEGGLCQMNSFRFRRDSALPIIFSLTVVNSFSARKEIFRLKHRSYLLLTFKWVIISVKKEIAPIILDFLIHLCCGRTGTKKGSSA